MKFMSRFTVNIIVLFFCLLVVINEPLKAVEPNSIIIQQKTSGGYCGVYCLYSAMELFEVKVNPNELMKPEYIGSEQGSSLAELKKAAEAFGLHAVPVSSLSLKDLRSSSSPIILHVKGNEDDKIYNHYVLYLGSRDGKASIYDPPQAIEQAEFWTLAPRWDGSGLLISDKPINIAQVFESARIRFMIFAGIVIAIILCIRLSRKHILGLVKNIRSELSLSVIQAAGISFFAIFTGIVFHLADEAGFLAHPEAVKSIAKADLGSLLPKVSAGDIDKISGCDKVIIDARQTSDYEAGHIKGAINIPAELSTDARNAKLAKLKKDCRLIIYCQSAGCGFAEKVAVNLMDDGFKNISIYKGGWIDWKKQNNIR